MRSATGQTSCCAQQAMGQLHAVAAEGPRISLCLSRTSLCLSRASLCLSRASLCLSVPCALQCSCICAYNDAWPSMLAPHAMAPSSLSECACSSHTHTRTRINTYSILCFFAHPCTRLRGLHMHVSLCRCRLPFITASRAPAARGIYAYNHTYIQFHTHLHA